MCYVKTVNHSFTNCVLFFQITQYKYRYRNNISKFALQFNHGIYLVIMLNFIAVTIHTYCILSKPCIPAAVHCIMSRVVLKQDAPVERSLNQVA